MLSCQGRSPWLGFYPLMPAAARMGALLVYLREVGALPGNRIDDLDDLTVQGIWEAHLEGELVPGDVVDDVAIRAAGVLAEKGYWMWLFQAATEDLTTWQDLHGGYWVVDPDKGYIWEWGT